MRKRKRFASLNPALKVVYSISYWLNGGGTCWVKADALWRISEPSAREMKLNEPKFLRIPGLRPQPWNNYAAHREPVQAVLR